MIKGLGIDLVKISRIENLMNKWGKKFLQKIYTIQEIDYCQQFSDSAAHFAVRFAAKEAVLKMLGTGLRNGIRWQDIATENNHLGQPQIKLSNTAAEIAAEKEIERIHLSLTHEKDYAMAEVIGEGGLK